MSFPSLSLSMPVVKKETSDMLEIRFVPTPLMRWVPLGLLGLLGGFLFLFLALIIPLRTEVFCRHQPEAQCVETDVFLLRRSEQILPLGSITQVSARPYKPKSGNVVYPIQLEHIGEPLIWDYAQTPALAENEVQKLRKFLADPSAAPIERKAPNDYLVFVVFGAFFGFGGWLLLRRFYQVLTGSVLINRTQGQLEARLWSKKGPQLERFNIPEIDRFRVESHGPICLIWMEVKDQSGPWILTWGISTGEGLRLEEKLSTYLGLD